MHKYNAGVPLYDHIGCNSSTTKQLQFLAAVAATTSATLTRVTNGVHASMSDAHAREGLKCPQSIENTDKQSQVLANMHMTCHNKAAKSRIGAK